MAISVAILEYARGSPGHLCVVRIFLPMDMNNSVGADFGSGGGAGQRSAKGGGGIGTTVME